MTERVLVLPRGEVPGGCDFHGMRPADDATLAALRSAVATHGRYLDRPIAEDDPDHKQLIPYVVVRDGARVFLMERTDAGGDRREDALMAGLRREWTEELDADWTPAFRLVGMLNDDSNPVGAVHLGVVFAVDASGRSVEVREREKLSGAFVAPDKVRGVWQRLETWSQLVATAIGIGVPPGR
jgi:predicted NUDIX family phosphoesterase